MRTRSGHLLAACAIAACACGCIPGLVEINAYPWPPPPRQTLREAQNARLQREAGVDDALWLEIDRARGAGAVGGYIADTGSHRGALLIILNGASTSAVHGEREAVLRYHRQFGADFRNAGFLTWSLVLPECRTPYGGEDLNDLVEVIDWLDGAGRAFLGVERVYVLGYSTGATLVNLLGPLREVTAIISLAGLTLPDQVENFYGLYDVMSFLFAGNTGFCQLRETLRTYGPPGSPAWSALDVVGRVEAFRSPALFMHGTADVVYVIENTLRLEDRYNALIAEGAELPPLSFEYIPGGHHWIYSADPALRQRMIAYLLQFEPAEP